MIRPTKLAAARKQFTGDRRIDEAQRLAQDGVRRANALPFAAGVFVPGVSIAATGTTVTHNLGRIPKGYVITRIYSTSAGTGFRENGDLTTTQAPFIAAGGTVVVDLLFF